MPFTPFHMGPGLAIKAVAGRRFSILAFGIAQVVMDIEPLVGIIRGADVLHGPTHTFLAAPVMACISALITPFICRPILRRWNRELLFHGLNRLIESESFSPLPVIAGAAAGTLSHVILDGIMHADISPLAPWSKANPFLDLISIELLHQFCILAGLLGILGWIVSAWRKRSASM